MSRRWVELSDGPKGSNLTGPSDDEAGDGPTVQLGAALDQLLRQRGMEDALVLGRVVTCWEDVVGPEVARQVCPQLVRDGELVVSVEHPAWATELELAGQTVLKRLAEELGDAAPRRLRVRVVPASRR